MIRRTARATKWRTATVLGCWLAVTSAAARAQDPQAPTWEDAPVRVTLVGVGALDVTARAAGRVLLFPLADIAALAEVRVLTDGRTAWRARMEPAGPELQLDLAARMGRYDTTRFVLSPDGAQRDSTGWWVDGAVLASLLGTGVAYDTSQVLLTISPNLAFPAVRRQLRDAQRLGRLGSATIAVPPADTVLGGSRTPLGGAVVEFAASAEHRDPSRNNTWSAGLGLAVAGGSLEARWLEQRMSTAETRQQRTVGWVRAWPDGRPVGQVLLGDVVLPGIRPRLLQGAAITNVPYLRPLAFGTRTWRGRTGPGWEVEVVRAGNVIAYARADSTGAYAVEVPQEYGPNYHDLVERSPLGQERRTSHADPVPYERLPAGRFEYVASGGACRLSACLASAGATARYGLTDRLTLEAGADGVRAPGQRDAIQPFLAVAAAPVTGVNVVADVVPGGFMRARTDVDPAPGRHFDLTLSRFDTMTTTLLLGRTFDRHRAEGNLFFVVPWTAGRSFLSLTGAYADGRATSRTATSGLLSVWVGGNTRALVGTRSLVLASAGRRIPIRTDQLGFEGMTGRLAGPLAGAFWRTGLSWEHGRGLADVGVSLAKTWGRVLQVSLEGGWQRDVGARLGVTMGSLAGSLRSFLVSRWDERNGATGVSGFEGTLLADPRAGSPTLWNGRALGQSGIVGEVFVDANANGVRDAGEDGVADARVIVGARVAVTDAAGRFRVWELLPFTRARIELDTTSLTGALLVPRHTTQEVVATPNLYRPVAFPLVPASDANGSVTFEGAPLANVRLLVRGVTTGRRRVVRTFSDGTFELTGLLPDRYEILVDADDLTRLDATAPLETFVLRSLPDGDHVDGLRVRLSPRTPSPRAPEPDARPAGAPAPPSPPARRLGTDSGGLARPALPGAITRTPEGPWRLSAQQIGPVSSTMGGRSSTGSRSAANSCAPSPPANSATSCDGLRSGA